MRKVAFRGLLARKLRLALTAVAVALGVTLIAGTYVFTDTINTSFDRIFTETNKGIDVALSPNNDLAGDEDPPPIPADVLTKVRDTPGVEAAEGVIFASGVSFRQADGAKLGGQGGFGAVSSASDDERFEGLDVVEGRKPRTADEVMIDKGLAKRGDFTVGSRIQIAAQAPKKTYTVVGLAEIAGVESLGGFSIVTMTLPEAQRVTGNENAFNEIDVAAAPGVSPAELATRLKPVAPPNVDVRTGEQQAASQSQDIKENLGFLRTALLAFAGISLFVGAFIIFNTFSITVQQRTREFALLRTLGARRRQVLRSVLAEGLVLGVAGSVIGLGLGIVVAAGLKALFKAVGFDVPANGTVVETRTIVISLLVGTIVTLVATLSPALRATRVPPIAALQEGWQRSTRRSRWATPLASLLTVLGLALMALGLFGSMDSSEALSFVGGGAALTFLGVALLSPRLVGPLASAIGRPMEALRGITGRLARENSVRQPGRTAVTSSALMIGVALVTFASVFASGAKATIDDVINNGSRAQAVVQNQNGFGSFSPQATRAVADTDGVREVAAVRFGEARYDGKSTNVTGIDPAPFSRLYNADWDQGGPATFRDLGPGEAIVSKGFHEDHDVEVGQTLRLGTALGREVSLRVTGILDDNSGLTGAVNVTNEELASQFGFRKDSFVLVGFDGARPADATLTAINAKLESQFPEAEALTNQEFADQQGDQVNQLLALIYALLALAIIVSLFGIVNTLVLSISERTRELGMLRAIGMSRRQVRRVIRYESVIVAAIGGVLGLVVGIVLSLLVTQAIDDFAVSIPWAQLVIVLALSGLAGVLAAILPARRASRLDVLDSLAYE